MAIPLGCQKCLVRLCEQEPGSFLNELWRGYPKEIPEKMKDFLMDHESCVNQIMLSAPVLQTSQNSIDVTATLRFLVKRQEEILGPVPSFPRDIF